METTLRVYDRAGARLGALPWSTLTRTVVRNAAGALTASVPRSLIPAGLLGDGERYLRVAVNGVEAPDWYVLDDDGDNDADDGGPARPVRIGATGAAEILDWGVVYSWEHTPGGRLLGLDPTYGFAAATPGHILAAFIDAAKARGCFPHLTYSFTGTHDSAGAPWPTSYARTYDVGTTIGKVLAGMAEDGWVDWQMVGFRLDVYLPDTVLAVDRPDVVLRLGQAVRSGPRRRTRKGARSTLLANGSEGAMVEVSDADAQTKWGRREGFEGRSGVTDVGTLTATTQVSLQRATSASESVTLELTPAALPGLDLPRPGGYVRYDQRRLSPTQLEPMRVQSIAWDYGDDPKVSVELADLWVDRDVRLARRVDAILNGSSANERVPVPPAGDDRVPPGVVTGLALVSAPFTDPTNGQVFAQVTASWSEITVDADGTAIDDLLGYTIEWYQPEMSAAAAARRVDARAGATSVSWSPVVPGTPVRARIAAFDRYTNLGAFSAWVEIMAGVDETPPPAPSTPLVDNYLGLLRVRWDGGFAGGAARPADLDRIEVHVSSLSGFAPDPRPIAAGGTLAGSMFAPGAVFVDTPYGALRYARLVGVDTTGNRSAVSAEASGATGQVVSADVFDGAVGTAKLADLAVKTAKIDLLAVNSAQVGSIDVGKLVAGTVTAEIVLGGRIATALTGQRVELNSLGIYRFDAAGNQTVAIDGNGALLTGVYRTAATGRRIEMGAGGTIGQIDFIGPDGRKGRIRGFTGGVGDVGVESIDIGVPITGVGWGPWNAVQFGDDEEAYLDSGRVHLTVGGDGPGRKDFTVKWATDRGDATRAPNTYRRMLIDFESEYHYIVENATADFAVLIGAGTDSLWAVYRYQDRHHKWWTGRGTGWSTMIPGNTNQGVGLQLFNNGGFGQLLKFFADGVGGNENQRMEFREWDDQGFTPVYASAFTVGSDEATKTGIAGAAAGEMLTAVRGTQVRRYRRVERTRARRQLPDGTVEETPLDAPEEIGLIAQEAPAQIQAPRASDGTQGVDLYQMTSMLWGAVTELADQVDALRAPTPPNPGGQL